MGLRKTMKTLSVVFVIALTSAVVHAQTRTMAETTYALNGPVRTVRTEAATFVLKDGHYVEGPRVLQTEMSFNEDGNRTDLYLYDDKGALTRRIVMRFEGRRLIEFLNYDGAGRMWLRGTSDYDDPGQVKEKTTYNGDNSLRSRTVFKRNKQGQVIELAEYSAKGTLMEKISSTYDGGQLKTSERNLYRADGSLQSTAVTEIPKKRRETTTYRPDGSVETKSVQVDQEIAEYAEDGSLQKTTTISSQGRLLDEVMVSKDGATKRESQTPDQIDAQGNWIKQTKWLTDSKGTRPVKVTYRAIAYYESQNISPRRPSMRGH